MVVDAMHQELEFPADKVFNRESSPDPVDPPPFYDQLRLNEPVLKVRLWDGSTAWLITRYQDLRSILSMNDSLSNDMRKEDFPTVTEGRKAVEQQERSFVTMDPPEHTRFKLMLTSEFMPKRLSKLEPHLESIVTGLLRDMVLSGAPADLVDKVAMRFPALVICELFGAPYEDEQHIVRCLSPRYSMTADAAETSSSAGMLVDYVRDLVAERQKSPKDDLLSRLINTYVSKGDLTPAQLADIGALVLRAGHDTTANAISLSTFLLLRNRDQFDLLKSEPALIPSSVEELLRFVSPVAYSPRRKVLKDIQVGDKVIRAGEAIFGILPSANRDESVFPDSNRFDPRRSGPPHVAFGHGVHQCLGQSLARLELAVYLKSLIRELPGLTLAVKPEDLRFKSDRHIYGIYELPVSW